jgi:hypothetical protein
MRWKVTLDITLISFWVIQSDFVAEVIYQPEHIPELNEGDARPQGE